jgi:hypothetical protein
MKKHVVLDGSGIVDDDFVAAQSCSLVIAFFCCGLLGGSSVDVGYLQLRGILSQASGLFLQRRKDCD